jgi:hypothetical protein
MLAFPISRSTELRPPDRDHVELLSGWQPATADAAAIAAGR